MVPKWPLTTYLLSELRRPLYSCPPRSPRQSYVPAMGPVGGRRHFWTAPWLPRRRERREILERWANVAVLVEPAEPYPALQDGYHLAVKEPS